mmetsp:Transcript_4670/g.9408  ORF Transcript_4670/g.9408 Transcript_4670/m.9408 type:complete len:160 (-) Transcript_4670:375-854(-)|eukprot:CAMPEP_0184681510 /NCGR_PEP_ID=MMETSP0312-20130426/4499_1 /TAXON_ID=31354 /ORGANISM="Compsopogon coeruleus, Strain SAG 36.94" /LENGTH=159 /DNA_ID=CAMNT_0027132411 /DNA_START=157 /DNA_END=636 /DNA_ORIENTATION=-
MADTVKLVSSDGEVFEVERGVAMMSVMVKNCMDDTADDENRIPIPNVDAVTLAKVIEFCRYQHEQVVNAQPEEDIEKWHREFVKVDKSTLFQLILASNYMDIQPLLDLTCKTVASMIKGKSPEQIRADFNIKSDFTPEEEAEVRSENAWCEERSDPYRA